MINRISSKRMSSLYLIFLLLFFFDSHIFSIDWPQFRGPDRNGISKETGLLKKWPVDGPRLKWYYEEVGEGYSSPTISEGMVYITGVINKKETIFAFDVSGTLIWQTIYGFNWKGSYPEVRTSATVDGSHLFVHSGSGEVVCLDAGTGKIKWKVQTVEQFNGEYDRWGIAESPLIVDGLVVATPGGPDASIVALDKNTGKKIWTSRGLSEKSSYCSPILVEYGGKKIITTMLENSFVGVDAITGKILWKDRYNEYQDDPKAINPVSPIYHNGFIYTSSGYDDGGAMYKLSHDGTKIYREWIDETLDIHHGGAVLVDGYIYGANWKDNRNGNWVCLEWSTGKVMYEKEWITKGSIIYADDMLYCYEEKNGNMALVSATPDEFNIISSFQVPLGSKQHWAHPAISDGKLYIRHGEALMVYDIKAN